MIWYLRFDPLPNVLHPQMDTKRELPIDKWSHTRQNARVVELADTLDLGSRYWEFESLLGYKLELAYSKAAGANLQNGYENRL